MTNKIYNMIGFAKRSGNIVVGHDVLVGNIMSKKVKLVIFAEDSSVKIRNKVIKLSDDNNIKYLEYGFKKEFGHILNKMEVSFLGIMDENMADYIQKHY